MKRVMSKKVRLLASALTFGIACAAAGEFVKGVRDGLRGGFPPPAAATPQASAVESSSDDENAGARVRYRCTNVNRIVPDALSPYSVKAAFEQVINLSALDP